MEDATKITEDNLKLLEEVQGKLTFVENGLDTLDLQIALHKSELETKKEDIRILALEMKETMRHIAQNDEQIQRLKERASQHDPNPVDLPVVEQEDVEVLEECLMTFKDKLDQQKIDIAAKEEVANEYEEIINELERRINAVRELKRDPLRVVLKQILQRKK